MILEIAPAELRSSCAIILTLRQRSCKIMSSDGDVKPGGPLGAFREEQAMSRHRVSPSAFLSSSSHTTQLHYINNYTYSHPNLNFLNYTDTHPTRNVVCPSGAWFENRPHSTPSIVPVHSDGLWRWVLRDRSVLARGRTWSEILASFVPSRRCFGGGERWRHACAARVYTLLPFEERGQSENSFSSGSTSD